MLFSSTYFVFLFLPAVLAAYHGLRIGVGVGAARYLLVAASLFFYGWWNPVYIALILISIGVNYSLGTYMTGVGAAPGRSRAALISGICFNLGLLAFYKYSAFAVASVSSLFLDYPILLDVVLPLAISFFTFQQIAFLVDVYRDNSIMKETTLEKYLCFVLFFPQLIAGPIVHHKQLVPQFGNAALNSVTAKHIQLGLAIFCLGLFKKVVLADQIAEISEPIFERHAEGRDVVPRTAWLGILAFTFRLYFDFSAYSDMAFGLGLMFGIILPVNFFSPYKATSINDTWARWNITLGHFFGNYVFKPLGGRSRGSLISVRNVVILMLLSGVWHGAGWNYLVWGLMQGCAMAWLVFWPGLMSRMGLQFLRNTWIYSTFFCCFVTFAFWVLSLVAFKVTRVDDMVRFYDILFSLSFAQAGEWLGLVWQQAGVFAGNLLGGGPVLASSLLEGSAWLVISALVVFLLPNVFEFLGVTRNGRIGRANLSSGRALLVGAAGGVAVAKVISSASSDFIYFVF
ncbi:MAG: MBOAT family O-acyltransferase [Halioglobus sp.]